MSPREHNKDKQKTHWRMLMERVSLSQGENSSRVTLPAQCRLVILLERHWVYVSPS